jgi:HEPN domain-containing protein
VKTVTETGRWLRDAEACLRSAQWAWEARDYRVAVQNAQLCVEFSAKAVIAQFAEPVWRHDPSPQLRRLSDTHAEALERQCGVEMLVSLRQLAEDAQEAAPWHAWSTYGLELEDQGWVAAVDLATEAVAGDLLQRAQRSLLTAQSLATLLSASPPPPAEEE